MRQDDDLMKKSKCHVSAICTQKRKSRNANMKREKKKGESSFIQLHGLCLDYGALASLCTEKTDTCNICCK